MPDNPRIPRDPAQGTRARRVAAAVQEMLNSLVKLGYVVRGSRANEWKLADVDPADLPGHSAPPVFFGDSDGDGSEGPMGPPGPPGPQGPQGETGPAGSGGGAGGYYPSWDEESDDGFFMPPASLTSGVSDSVASAVGWPIHADQLADEQVEDSTALVASSYLSVGVTAGVYEFVLFVMYSGNNAAMDFKFDLSASAGNLNGYFQFVGDNTTADAVLQGQIRVTAGATWAAPISAGTDASDTVRYVRVHGTHTFSADCAVTLRHANTTGGAGRISKLRSGSYMRFRKVR